ncbi:MAG TPA: hypothetical protein VF487_13480 [Chitinophagaceae bacterium]
MSVTSLLRSQADSIHATYHTRIRELEQGNRQLQVELQSTKAELKAAKEKAGAKAAQLRKIIKAPGFPAKELLKKTSVPFTPTNDGLQNCDSLALLAGEYLQFVEQKDSLYEIQMTQYDSLLSRKDAIIALREHENLSQAILFSQSLKQQTVLEKNNFQLNKKLKRQRSARKWLVVGSALLSGIITHHISNK